jgi:molybdopterin-guanine dinucleotide biosynthesis protein B
MKLIGLAGWSGAGKTTLLTRVIPVLIARGLRVSTIKHAHHKFDVDTPGKDSFAHREAGASEVLVSSGRRFALMHELRGEAEWPLRDLLRKLTPVDLVIVEGFKADPHPKIEVHRIDNGKPFLHPQDSAIVAVATDARTTAHVPVLALDDILAIADMMVARAVPLEDILSLDGAGA